MLHNFILLRAQIAAVIATEFLIPTHEPYTTALGFTVTFDSKMQANVNCRY